MQEPYEPGQVFEACGRYWRVRLKKEKVRPTDYAVNPKNLEPQFQPNVQVGTRLRRPKTKFHHVHEIDILVFNMAKVMK